jgi:hypothetical protein
MDEEDGDMVMDTEADTGVRVVGVPKDEQEDMEAPGKGKNKAPREARVPTPPSRRRFVGMGMLAVAGLVGTLVFGLLWAGKTGTAQADPAMTASARSFLLDLTNFNAKSVDSDFSAITNMATGPFSSQATKFFNSSIRGQLETALAESRGQIRYLEVQSSTATTGSVYGVVDQTYVNNKISTPQTDVLRVIVNLQKVGSSWKVSDVTVLEGATPASEKTPSGSAGSSVVGQ